MTYYTITQAASIAGVTVQAIKNWIRNGTLPSILESNRRYITHNDLMSRKSWKNKHNPPSDFKS